jgi:hypothetical protein
MAQSGDPRKELPPRHRPPGEGMLLLVLGIVNLFDDDLAKKNNAADRSLPVILPLFLPSDIR